MDCRVLAVIKFAVHLNNSSVGFGQEKYEVARPCQGHEECKNDVILSVVCHTF